MEKKKSGTIFLAVVCIGLILSAVGTMIASGLNQGEFIYSAFQNAFFVLNILFLVGIAVLYQNGSETEEDGASLEII